MRPKLFQYKIVENFNAHLIAWGLRRRHAAKEALDDLDAQRGPQLLGDDGAGLGAQDAPRQGEERARTGQTGSAGVE